MSHSKNLAKFSRLGSPLRWQGGKRKLARTIIGCFGEHKAYIEACCGGAAVFWAKPKDMSASEVLNDLDGELINFYVQLHRAGKRLAGYVDTMPYSRSFFKKMLRSKPNVAFSRAARFWYLNRVAFSGKRHNPSFGVQAGRRVYVLPALMLHNLDATIERLRGVVFESVDVCRLLAVYDKADSLFYIDPPYWGTQQDYEYRFGDPEHDRLAEALGNVTGRWLLSYNDYDQVRTAYKRYFNVPLMTRYTMSGGGGKQAAELLISNKPMNLVD